MQSSFGQVASTASHGAVSSQNRICDFAIGSSQSGTLAGRGSAWGPAPARFSCSTCPPASRIYGDTILRFYGAAIVNTTARAIVSSHPRKYSFAMAYAGAFRVSLVHATRQRGEKVACGALPSASMLIGFAGVVPATWGDASPLPWNPSALSSVPGF